MAGIVNFGLNLDTPDEREELRRRAGARTESLYRESLVSRQITLDDFYQRLPLAVGDDNPFRAMNNLRVSAGFLSDDDHGKLPWYLRRDA